MPQCQHARLGQTEQCQRSNRIDDIGTQNHRLAMESIDQRTDQWAKHDARKHGNQRTRSERSGRPIGFGDPPDECKSRERAADTGNGFAHPKNPKAGDPAIILCGQDISQFTLSEHAVSYHNNPSKQGSHVP